MRYEWKCSECDHVVEIIRPVAQYQQHPNASEANHSLVNGCTCTQFTRVISAPVSIRVYENEAQYRE